MRIVCTNTMHVLPVAPWQDHPGHRVNAGAAFPVPILPNAKKKPPGGGLELNREASDIFGRKMSIQKLDESNLHGNAYQIVNAIA